MIRRGESSPNVFIGPLWNNGALPNQYVHCFYRCSGKRIIIFTIQERKRVIVSFFCYNIITTPLSQTPVWDSMQCIERFFYPYRNSVSMQNGVLQTNSVPNRSLGRRVNIKRAEMNPALTCLIIKCRHDKKFTFECIYLGCLY